MKLLIAALSAAFLTATVLPLMSSDAYAGSCTRNLNCKSTGFAGNVVKKPPRGR